MMLILEVLVNLNLKQGNVTAAFLRAYLAPEERVFVEMPLGFIQAEGKGSLTQEDSLWSTPESL